METITMETTYESPRWVEALTYLYEPSNKTILLLGFECSKIVCCVIVFYHIEINKTRCDR